MFNIDGKEIKSLKSLMLFYLEIDGQLNFEKHFCYFQLDGRTINCLRLFIKSFLSKEQKELLSFNVVFLLVQHDDMENIQKRMDCTLFLMTWSQIMRHC